MCPPPETDRDPVVEECHGERIVDPYRWLEAGDETVHEWEQAQNAYTDEVVDTERRTRLRPKLEAVARRSSFELPVACGGRYFQLIEAAEADQPRLTVRDDRDADPRTLVDPSSLGDTASVPWFVPAPDGDLVVYGVMSGGTEAYDLRVLDVDSGEVIDRLDDVGRCGEYSVAWDGDGFYYLSTGGADGSDQLEKELRFHDVKGEDRLVTDDIPPERWPQVQVDRETGLVVVGIGEIAGEAALYALENGDLVPVITGVDATFEPLVHAGRVYLRTNHEAPRFRLLAIDAADFASASGLADFELAIPESDDVLVDVAPAGDGLAVHRLRDAASVVSLHAADGTERHELSLSEYAGIARTRFGGSGDTDEVVFALDGFDRPTTIVHADAGPDAGPDDWEVIQSPDLPADLDPRADLDLTVDRRWVDSTDDARVPVYVVHRADVEPDASTPAVLWGYGGFRNPQLPRLDPSWLPFLADGGVFAVACLRGGLEFGEEWHEAGARAQKEQTFDDYEAAAEALIEWGYTSPERLAGWGRSNGGLTVGAALTRQPERFGAIVCGVPLLDMLRFHQHLLGATWIPEYGSPDDPEAFAWLRSYSPYHNVDEQAYPATLFVTAAGDSRVHPCHARKMAARVQAETTADAPICYRSYDASGHGLGTPTSLEVEQQLDRWTFLYEVLAIDPIRP